MAEQERQMLPHECGPTTRTCLCCEHFDYDPGSPGYSEVTPGWEGHSECLKGNWTSHKFDGPSDVWRAMTQAPACPHFKHVALVQVTP